MSAERQAQTATAVKQPTPAMLKAMSGATGSEGYQISQQKPTTTPPLSNVSEVAATKPVAVVSVKPAVVPLSRGLGGEEAQRSAISAKAQQAAISQQKQQDVAQRAMATVATIKIVPVVPKTTPARVVQATVKGGELAQKVAQKATPQRQAKLLETTYATQSAQLKSDMAKTTDNYNAFAKSYGVASGSLNAFLSNSKKVLANPSDYNWATYPGGLAGYKANVTKARTDLVALNVQKKNVDLEYAQYMQSAEGGVKSYQGAIAQLGGTFSGVESVLHPILSSAQIKAIEAQAAINELIKDGVIAGKTVKLGDTSSFSSTGYVTLKNVNNVSDHDKQLLASLGVTLPKTTQNYSIVWPGTPMQQTIRELKNLPSQIYSGTSSFVSANIYSPLDSAISDLGSRITAASGLQKADLQAAQLLLVNAKTLAATSTFLISPDMWIQFAKQMIPGTAENRQFFTYIVEHPFDFVESLPGGIVGGYFMAGAIQPIYERIPTGAIANTFSRLLGDVGKKIITADPDSLQAAVYYASKADPNSSFIEFQGLEPTTLEKLGNIVGDLRSKTNIPSTVINQETIGTLVQITRAVNSLAESVGDAVARQISDLASNLKQPFMMDAIDEGELYRVGKLTFVTDKMLGTWQDIVRTHPGLQFTIDEFGQATFDLKTLIRRGLSGKALDNLVSDLKVQLSKFGGDVQLVDDGKTMVINDVRVVNQGSDVGAIVKDYETVTSERVANGEIRWMDTIDQKTYDNLLKDGKLTSDSLVSDDKTSLIGGREAKTEMGLGSNLYQTLISDGASQVQAVQIVADVMGNGPASATQLALNMNLNAAIFGAIMSYGNTMASLGQNVVPALQNLGLSQRQIATAIPVILNPTTSSTAITRLDDQTKGIIIPLLTIPTLVSLIPTLDSRTQQSVVQKLDTPTIISLMQNSNVRQDIVQALNSAQIQSIMQQSTQVQVQNLILDLTQDQIQDQLQMMSQIQIQELVLQIPDEMLFLLNLPRRKIDFLIDLKKEKGRGRYRVVLGYEHGKDDIWVDVAKNYVDAFAKAMARRLRKTEEVVRTELRYLGKQVQQIG